MDSWLQVILSTCIYVSYQRCTAEGYVNHLIAVLKANPKAEEDWLRQREIAAQLDTDFVERVDHSADKLNKLLMYIVLALFSLVCLLLVTQLNLTRGLMAELLAVLQQTMSTDTVGLSHPATGGTTTRLITVLYNFVTIGGYIGCLVFFFYQRSRKNRD